MPTYNADPFLDECIESILGQSHSDIEFIIINDGSTDNSDEIIAKWTKKDSRIKHISHSKSKGVGLRMNEAFELSSGDYIAKMDADDIAYPHRFETQLQYLKENNLDLIGSNAIIIDEYGKQTGTIIQPETDNDIRVFCGSESPFIHPSVMYKKTLSQIKFRSLETRQDYLWLADCLIQGARSGNIQEPLLKYRRHSHNSSSFKKNRLLRFAIGLHFCRNSPLTTDQLKTHTANLDKEYTLKQKTAYANTAFNHAFLLKRNGAKFSFNALGSLNNYLSTYLRLLFKGLSLKAIYRHYRYRFTMLRQYKSIETLLDNYPSNN